MSLRTAIAIFVSTIVGIVLLVIVYVHTIDFNRYRQNLIAELSETTGRAVSIDGTVDLAFGLESAFVISGLRIANAPWGTREDLIKVGRIEARFQVLPLLAGRITINRLRLVEADLWLETDGDGNPNWLVPVRAAGGKKERRDVPAHRRLLGTLGVARLDISSARVAFRDGRSGGVQVLAVTEVTADGYGFAEPGTVKLEGSWNGLPLSVEGRVGPLAALLREGTSAYPIDLTGKLAGMQLEAKGTVAHPVRGEGVSLQFDARADRLIGFEPLLGKNASRLAHMAMSGKLEIHGNHVSIQEFRFGIGESNVAGRVDLAFGGAILKLEADLTSSGIDLITLAGENKGGSLADEPGVVDAVDAKRVLPEWPLRLNSLRALNGDLKFRGSAIGIGAITVSSVKMNATLRDGVLTISKLSGHVLDSPVEARASLSVIGKVPRLTLKATSPKFMPGPFLQRLDGIAAFDGLATVHVDLAGEGETLAAAVGGAHGEIVALMGRGKVAIDPLENDPFGFATSGAVALIGMLMRKGGKGADLRCAASRLVLRDGVAVSAATVLESNDAVVMADGRIDFRDERFDMVIAPYSKGKRLALADRVRMRGPLHEPAFSTVPAGKAAGRLPRTLKDLVKRRSGDNNCVRRMRRMPADGAAAKSGDAGPKLPITMPE